MKSETANFLKIKANKLLLIAGGVWLAAGGNVLRIGVSLYKDYLDGFHLGLSLLVYLCFYYLIFSKLVRKHRQRIAAYREKQWFFHFFDRKSFLIMVCMMSFGIWLRASGLASERFIAVFYSGLGAALSMAGLSFSLAFFRTFEGESRAKNNPGVLSNRCAPDVASSPLSAWKHSR